MLLQLVSDLGIFGWVLLIIGVLLLLAEAASPGFFVAVPGTVLIVLGIIILMFPEFLDNEWAPLTGVLVAIIAGTITILLYRRIAPGQRPQATSMDTLVGKVGIVNRAIEPNTIKGKVRIDNMIWSATADGKITTGTKIKVIGSKGVHVKVKEEK